MTVLVVLEGFIILILAVLVVGLLRSHAEILRELPDYPKMETTTMGPHPQCVTELLDPGRAR